MTTTKRTPAKKTQRAVRPVAQEFTEPVSVSPSEALPTTDELVAHVKATALKHYEDGGWDVIVETWDDAKIVEKIGRARTYDGAIRKVLPDIFMFQAQDRERAAMLADA